MELFHALTAQPTLDSLDEKYQLVRSAVSISVCLLRAGSVMLYGAFLRKRGVAQST